MKKIKDQISESERKILDSKKSFFLCLVKLLNHNSDIRNRLFKTTDMLFGTIDGDNEFFETRLFNSRCADESTFLPFLNFEDSSISEDIIKNSISDRFGQELIEILNETEICIESFTRLDHYESIYLFYFDGKSDLYKDLIKKCN
jgi:hypothetical protein